MSKLQDIRNLVQEHAVSVSSSPGNWMDYMDTASRLYRYSFSDQLLIHAQRPDATACASLELWNEKMLRWVNRGARGIALFDEIWQNTKLHYVFDISDTHMVAGGRSLYLWQMQEHQREEKIPCSMKKKKYPPPDRKNWNRTVRKRLMKLCFFMEKAAVLQSIRWILVDSILISLWELESAQKLGYTIDGKDYRMVYAAPWIPTITLEDIFERFNINRPNDFHGHSLSVSDVIVINRMAETKAYYVDSFGFEELPDFVQQRMEMLENNHIRAYPPVYKGTLAQAMEDILEDEDMSLENEVPVDYEDLMAEVEEAGERQMQLAQLLKNCPPSIFEDYDREAAVDTCEGIAMFTKSRGYLIVQATEEGYFYIFYDSDLHEIHSNDYDDPKASVQKVTYEILKSERIKNYFIVNFFAFMKVI